MPAKGRVDGILGDAKKVRRFRFITPESIVADAADEVCPESFARGRCCPRESTWSCSSAAMSRRSFKFVSCPRRLQEKFELYKNPELIYVQIQEKTSLLEVTWHGEVVVV